MVEVVHVMRTHHKHTEACRSHMCTWLFTGISNGNGRSVGWTGLVTHAAYVLTVTLILCFVKGMGSPSKTLPKYLHDSHS